MDAPGAHDRIVRTEVVQVAWWESSYFYMPECEDSAHKAHHELLCSGAPECEQVGRSVEMATSGRWALDRERQAARVRLRVTGRLVGPGEYGTLGASRYVFKVQSIQAADPVPAELPYRRESE